MASSVLSPCLCFPSPLPPPPCGHEAPSSSAFPKASPTHPILSPPLPPASLQAEQQETLKSNSGNLNEELLSLTTSLQQGEEGEDGRAEGAEHGEGADKQGGTNASSAPPHPPPPLPPCAGDFVDPDADAEGVVADLERVLQQIAEMQGTIAMYTVCGGGRGGRGE